MSKLKSICWPLLILIASNSLSRDAVAQKKTWGKFATFSRVVDSDPRKDYSLTEQHGPWMILAATFAGPTATEEARSLALELRKRFKLNAYIHTQTYDFTKPVEGRGFNKYGEAKMMRYRQNKKFDEIAVMVGDFPNIDDPNLQATLKKLKYAKPHCMVYSNDKSTSQRFAGLRALQRKISGSEEIKSKGPLGKAFAARNPLLPQEFFTPDGIDSFVVKLNEGVRYCLLDCPAAYSVQVATFSGNVVIDPKQVAKIEESGRMESKLMVAAEKAHVLVEELRKRGVEAYEFHDRSESVVAVGSFDSVGHPRQDGKIEINPQILKVIESYGARQTPLPDGRESGMTTRSLQGIPFDVQPIPIKVPKRSIAADYSRR